MAAGVLALALGGAIPAVAIVPVSAARASAVTLMNDCDHGGLLGTVTGGVCHVVDDLVHGLENGAPPSSPPSGERAENTDSAETSTDVQETPAEARTPAPAASASKHPSGKKPPTTRGRGESSGGGPRAPRPADPTDACGSAATSSACADSSVAPLTEEPDKTEETNKTEETARPEASPTPSPSATPSASPSRREGVPPARKSPVPVPTDRLPPPATSPPDTRTLTTDVGEPVSPSPSPVVDAEAPRVELLWPAPVMQELQRRMPSERPVTPSRSSDTASTVLSTVVLVSAILAVRLLYSRRKVRESIPFEPAPPGHHRVA
jgi:hypothetical protein